jgi:hypothetical protein
VSLHPEEEREDTVKFYVPTRIKNVKAVAENINVEPEVGAMAKEKPPLQTPTSGTPAAGAPSAVPTNAVGLRPLSKR